MTRRTIERIMMIAMVLFVACTIVSFSYSQDLGEKINKIGAEVKFFIKM